MDLISDLPFVDEITVAESAVNWLPQATVARFVGRWVPALACMSLRAPCPDGLGTKLKSTGGARCVAAAKEAKRGVKLLGALSDWRALSTWAADMAALRQALALRVRCLWKLVCAFGASERRKASSRCSVESTGIQNRGQAFLSSHATALS